MERTKLNPFRRRWQVVTTTPQNVVTRYGVTILTPTISHRGKKFWFVKSALRFARELDVLAWKYRGQLYESTVEGLS